MSALDAALATEYWERQLALVPLAPRSKAPHTKLLKAVYGETSWPILGDRRASPPEIQEWIRFDPKLNIGVITGPASGGLVVVDVDVDVPGLRHPATPTVQTRRGRHLYVRGDLDQATEKYEWGEVRAGGSYVVAPPSIHPDGPDYEWQIGLDDADLADLSEVKLPDQAFTALQNGGVLRQIDIPEYPSEEKVGEETQLAADPAAVRRACGVLGIEAPLGKAFLCVLHEETNPSASLFPDQEGVFRYHDWHERDGAACLSLARVRASLANKRVVDLPLPSVPRWYARLFYEAGCLTPAPVEMPSVPSACRPSVHKVAKGFELLLGLRWLREPGQPTPFTWDFAGPWSGVSRGRAGNAILELRRLGVITVVGQAKWGDKRAHLYLPGDGIPWRGGRP